MRAEKRNLIWIVLMVVSIVAIVVAAQVRLYHALPYITVPASLIEKEDGTVVSGEHGTIATRDGEVVFDGTDTMYPEFYTLVGNVADGAHLSTYTLGYHYRNDLMPSQLTVYGGIHAMSGLSGVRMETTLLPGPAQQMLHEAYGGMDGALVCYNYETGEMYASLSLPSAQEGTEDDEHLINQPMGFQSPGSTMKIVTLICALSQNPELQEMTYTCSGEYLLQDGSKVDCAYVHYGPLTMTDAIGCSCNCYFARLAEQLDPDQVNETLEALGFSTLSKPIKKKIDAITYTSGVVNFENNVSNRNIWSMIGQQCTVSMIDMVRIAGAVANGGTSAEPYLVQRMYDPNQEEYTYQREAPVMTSLMDPAVAELVDGLWTDAVEAHYRTGRNKLDSRISHAKTGTAEVEGAGEKYNNRLLLGVMEEYHTAFMIMVKRTPSGDTTMIQVANVLAQILASSDLS